jgi:O-antigen/teichoic acid export membrane protein
MGAGQFLVMVLLPGCALVAAEAKGVMELIYGERYIGGALPLSVLVFAFGLFYTSLMTFAGILIAMGRSLLAAGITLYIIPLQLVASIVLISKWGAAGAALSAALAAGAGAWVSGYIVHKRMGPLLLPLVTAKVLVATAIMVLIAIRIPTQGFMLVVEGVAVFALFLFILGLFRALNWDDLKVFVPAVLRRA